MENKIFKKRYYTLEERKHIQEFIKRKYSVDKISKLLNRTNGSVQAEIFKGGGYKTYDAEKRHSKVKSRLENSVQGLLFELPNNQIEIDRSLEQRILCLEMQLDTILEIIKERINDN